MLKELWELRETVREQKPLVYNITNQVVTNFSANVLLAAGASPIMSEGAAEADDLAKIADALVLNMGTLHTRQVSYFLKAGECANRYGKPIVFDPVGVGATAYRNMTAMQVLQDLKLSVIRGNYGEIGCLAGLQGQVKGVDSVSSRLELEPIQTLAGQTGAVIAATGATDYVATTQGVWYNAINQPLLQYVTGTGCALSALIGAFVAVSKDNPAFGVLAALTYYGAAAEKAARKSKGPGSFAVKFIDALYTLRFKDFASSAQAQVGVGEPQAAAEEEESEDAVDFDASRESGSAGLAPQ